MARGEGAEHLAQHVAGQGVRHADVHGTAQDVVAPKHAAAVRPGGLAEGDVVADVLLWQDGKLCPPRTRARLLQEAGRMRHRG